MPLRSVAMRSFGERTARTRDRLEAAIFSSLGVALMGSLAAMAAIGLLLSATRPPISADEGTALSTARAAASGAHHWIEMLAPPIQVAFYAPFFVIGQPGFATVVPTLFGALLLILVVVVAWRITGMVWAGAIAGLFLLSSPEYWLRSSNLVAYQPFVFFGYSGLFLIAWACRDPRRSTAFAVAGGIALALSVYSFTMGTLFLAAPLLLALAWKVHRKTVLLGLSATAVLLVPFAVWHIAAAGVRNAWFYPHNFLLLEYSDDFQGFLNRPNYDLPGYLTGALPEMLLAAAPIWLWLLAGGGLLIIGRVYGARVSATIAAAMVAALIPFVAVEQPPHARYGYVLVPAIALVAAVGADLAVRALAQHQARHRLSVAAPLVLAFMAVLAASVAISVHLEENVRTARATPQYVDLEAIANEVDDDRALLARTSYLQALLPDNQVYTHLFFSEDEYLDYILWQDEEEVRQLFADRDIGWVVFQKNIHRWERDFNFWAYTATGQPPRHYICLPQSTGFTEVYDGNYFTLYQVNQDWLQAESVSGSCTVPACEMWSLPGAWRQEAGTVSGQSYCDSP